MKYVLLALLGVMVVSSIKDYFRRRKEDREEEDFLTDATNVNTSNVNATVNTYGVERYDAPNITFEALQAIGCQPQRLDDGNILVKYQGETFRFDFGDSPTLYTRIWDLGWAGMRADDPNLYMIKEAVNRSNYNFGPTILLTQPDDNNVIAFHSRYDIMLHPACPDNALYIKSCLDSFFSAKESVRTDFHTLNAEQAAQHKNRRPIGFTTSPTPSEQVKQQNNNI